LWRWFFNPKKDRIHTQETIFNVRIILMSSKTKPIDRILLFTVLTLLVLGLIIFLSASLGLLARDGVRLGSVAFNQIFFGLFLGGLVCFTFANIPYRFLGAYSVWLYLLGIILTFAVLIPGVGIGINGAQRWIMLGPLSFQPSEFLKIAYILFLAMWFSSFKTRIDTFKFGLIPFLAISGLAALPLVLQPDMDTTLIMLSTGFVVYLVAGAKMQHLAILAVIGLIGAGAIIAIKPYVLQRVTTFLNPAENSLTSGYQIQQSLIAIGSGNIVGRGFGQSIQKFNYLPEPTSDSIFAVASEEFGFVGSLIIIALFFTLLFRGVQLSNHSLDTFGGLVMLGIVIMIVSQSFLNIASMLGLFPLSGLPLLFISKGGTALFFTLFATGIIFNISRYQQKI
jgi:cell division protein FtsW